MYKRQLYDKHPNKFWQLMTEL